MQNLSNDTICSFAANDDDDVVLCCDIVDDDSKWRDEAFSFSVT